MKKRKPKKTFQKDITLFQKKKTKKTRLLRKKKICMKKQYKLFF